MRLEIDIQHVAVVETEDMPLFGRVRHADGLTLIPTAAVLPAEIERARSAGRSRARKYVPRLGRIGRTRVDGWVTQQMVKLGVAATIDCNYVCLDSDVVFLRRMTVEDFYSTDGRLLTVVVNGIAGEAPLRYRRAAEEFFGLEQSPVSDRHHYTSPIFPMSRTSTLNLLSHLEKRGGAPWWRVFLAHDLAEFSTYGVYVQRVAPDPGLVTRDPRWTWLHYGNEELAPLVRRLVTSGAHPALMVHSRLGVSVEAVRSAVQSAWDAAAP